MADLTQVQLPNGTTYDLKDPNVPHDSKQASSGGTTLSLVTTGEKYTWNSKGSGTVTSVATGTGLTGGTITTSGTISLANHKADFVRGGYLFTHPESGTNATIIPFINNDMAYTLIRGGSAITKYDGVTQSIDISTLLDCSPTTIQFNGSTITTISFEITLHMTFVWNNTAYVDFSGTSWRAKDVKFEVINTNYPEDVWTEKYHSTTNAEAYCYANVSHKPVGADNAGGGFNKIRFTFTDFYNKTATNGFRVAQLGIVNFQSKGLRETFLPKDGGSTYGTIYPYVDNTWDLGRSNYRWKNGYFTNINGVAVGSSPKFTDTTYTIGTSGYNVTLTPSSGSAQSITVPYASRAGSIATEVGSSAGARPVFYAWLGDNSKVVYDTAFTYNPDGGAVTATKFVGALQGNADTATKATQDESGNNIKATYANSFSISDHTITLKNKNGGSLGTVTVPDNDTKNTAGSTDTSSKIFLIGATSQAANPQTYSDNEVYATSGVLTTKSVQIGGGSCTLQYNSTTKSCDFVFT